MTYQKLNIKEYDSVNYPRHYTQGRSQPLDFIESNNLNFHQGNILKYTVRYKYKNGVEDLEKAKFYLERLIALEKEKKKKSGLPLKKQNRK